MITWIRVRLWKREDQMLLECCKVPLPDYKYFPYNAKRKGQEQ